MESVNVMRVCVCVGGGNCWIALFRFWALWKIRRFILRNSARQFQLLFAQHAGWVGRQLAPSIKFSITFMISCALFHFPIFPISHRQDMYIRTMILFAFLFALFWFLFLCRFYCIIFSAGDSSFYACVYSGMKRFWRNGEM